MSLGKNISDKRKWTKSKIQGRENERMSQSELARLTGVSLQAISNIENDKSIPQSDLLARIADALSVKVDDLIPTGTIWESGEK